AGGEVEGDGLPADGAALLSQQDDAARCVEVLESQAEGAASSAGGFGVQSEQERVEDGVVAAGAGDGVDLGEFVGCQCSPGAGQASGFADAVCGTFCLCRATTSRTACELGFR